LKSKALVLLTLLLSFSIVLVACGAPSGQGSGQPAEEDMTDLQLGTGSVGGTYYPLGAEMANVLNEHVDAKGFNVSAVETGASVENLAKIGSGDLQLGMSVNVTAVQAQEGTGEFEGRPVKNFGAMGQIYPEVLQIVTLESAGIESVEDLRDKPVAIGPPGSATQGLARQVLSAYGIEEGDYQPFEEAFADAKGKLQDGRVAASFELLGVPGPTIEELQATTRDVKILSLTEDATKEITQAGYESYEIPANTYGWIDEPISTVSAFAWLFGSTNQVSEKLGYQITKALFEHADEISHPQAESITIDNALRGRLGLPLHPGAEKYFREKGILKE
jgi:uncharacterized protein